jgi:glyoxylase-like metal-dependent hydrolase (beta-lactamase superfamily II)
LALISTQIKLEVLEITDWLWSLRMPLVLAYAVRERGGFNLIDAGIAGCGETIIRALADIENTSPADVVIHDILLTHGHDDHIGGAAELVARTKARVLASAIDAPVIESSRSAPSPRLLPWEVPLYEQTQPQVPPAPPVRVDIQLQDGDLLPWSKPAKVIATPGHTAGSVAALFPADRVVVAGDAIASHAGRPMLGVFNSDPPAAMESFCRLASLDVEIACFGHGEPVLAGANTALTRAIDAGPHACGGEG